MRIKKKDKERLLEKIEELQRVLEDCDGFYSSEPFDEFDIIQSKINSIVENLN